MFVTVRVWAAYHRGLIGRSFAMIFASGGYKVTLFDLEPDQVSKAKADIQTQLGSLEREGLLRGSLSVQQQFDLITGVTDLATCVKDAFFVLECVPERLDIKRSVWSQVDPLVTDDVILSSSTSALLPSAISEGLRHKDRFVICHPTNPPFYAPLVEVVPSQWTRADVVQTTMELLREVGQVPVLVKKEVAGFVLNRLQFAIMGEAWRLVRDGVISAGDLDKVMSSGLGTRYAFIGPWETAYLNAEGMDSYVERYADMIFDIQKHQESAEKMALGPTLDAIKTDMEAVAGPISDLQTRRQWRDNRLAALAKLKVEMAAADQKAGPSK
ncbi:lambda-crystallin-like isoform X2 [Littorina saxatilis]|uniref:lambda-crystallin-like isoform X2 n=1 Tax=Littorina saxatilis TaxID=31220 RepID=UPI0038B5DD3E